MGREDSLDTAINRYTDSEHARFSRNMPIQQRSQIDIAIGTTRHSAGICNWHHSDYE